MNKDRFLMTQKKRNAKNIDNTTTSDMILLKDPYEIISEPSVICLQSGKILYFILSVNISFLL